MNNLGNQLIPWLVRTAKMLDYYQNKELQSLGFDLTKEQFVALKILSDCNGASQNKLACITNRDKTSMTRLVNTLEKKNYIARIPSQEDKRINQLFITKAGEKILNDVTPYVIKNIDKLQKGVNVDETNMIIDALKRIQKNIGELDDC